MIKIDINKIIEDEIVLETNRKINEGYYNRCGICKYGHIRWDEYTKIEDCELNKCNFERDENDIRKSVIDNVNKRIDELKNNEFDIFCTKLLSNISDKNKRYISYYNYGKYLDNINNYK